MAPSIGPSHQDVTASVGWYLAEKLLANGYLVYWYAIDALQTGPSVWYFQYRAQQTTHLAVPALQASLAAAKGIVSIMEPTDGVREWQVQATVGGAIPAAPYVPIPSVEVDVGPVVESSRLELGTPAWWRSRTLDVAMSCRTLAEQRALEDGLALWFASDTLIPVRDYATGTGATLLDQFTVVTPAVLRVTSTDDTGALVYQVGCSAYLEYTA